MTGSSPPRPSRAFALLLLALALACPDRGWAHARTVSHSRWVASGSSGWNVQATMPVLELDRRFGPGGWDEDTARAYTLGRFQALTEKGPCSPHWLSGSVVQTDFIADWTMECPAPARTLRMEPFFDSAPSHLHYARVRTADRTLDHIITAATPTLSLVRSRPYGIADYFHSGLLHLLAGPDHVLFLIGLALLARSLLSLLKIVTAFTIAHALSLSALALGLVKAAPRSVEALIGLSILVIAAEVFIARAPLEEAPRWRVTFATALGLTAIPAAAGWLPIAPLALLGFGLINLSLIGLDRRGTDRSAIAWIHAMGFGLIHGMGIAGALGAIQRGSGGSSLLVMIFGFNLGVEVGQVLIVLGLFLLFPLVVRLTEQRAWMKWHPDELVASALMGVGMYWFLGRAMALT